MKASEIKIGGIYFLPKNSFSGCGAIDETRDNLVKITNIDTNGLHYDVYKLPLKHTKAKVIKILSRHPDDVCSLCVKPEHLLPNPYEESQTLKKVGFDSVIIPIEKKEQILAAISQTSNNEKIFSDWGFNEVFEKGTAVSLLFYGVPGTGKTLTAQAIADELKMEIKVVSSGDIESSEPGGAERAIAEFFKEAQEKYEKHKSDKNSPAQILLFDECDSLLMDRNLVGVILGAQVNALLTSLEKYEGVCVFTTNRLGKLDPALERRITAKIEFEFPNEEQRVAIWKRMIPKKAPIDKDVDFEELGRFPMTGGNIKNAVLNAARMSAYKKTETINRRSFLMAIESELKGIQSFMAAYEADQKTAVRPAHMIDFMRDDTGLNMLQDVNKEKMTDVVV